MVQPHPKQLEYCPAPHFAGYLFVHFVNEVTPDGEQVYFALSEENSLVSWRPLNNGRPVLRSDIGTGGVRDPFLLRLTEGGFVLLATDLRVYGVGDFQVAQENGSRSLLIWRSPDLVNWSDPQLIEVAPPEAGNVWAPEALWVEELGRYAVYWASNLYPEASGPRRVATSYNRMMITTTRDFVTFDEPRVWIDVRRGPGYGTIDSTVVRAEDGRFVRVTKDEQPDIMDVFQEWASDITATTIGTIGSGWHLEQERIGSRAVAQAEGPVLLRSNVGDKWFLLVDWPPYGGGRGYVVFETTDLTAANWRPSDILLPSYLRHGSVLPITAQEKEGLEMAWESVAVFTGRQD